MSSDSDEYVFEVDLFIVPPDQELICPICKCVMKNPQQLGCCEHMFCQTCISSHIQSNPMNNYCPIDKKPVTMANIKLAQRAIQNMINRLQMKCIYHTEGCNEIITVENIDKHLIVCRSCSGRRSGRKNPTPEAKSGTNGTTINVFVQMVDTGRIAVITINSDDTILLLKQRIHEKEGVDPENQILAFKAKPLNDPKKSLSYYGIQNNGKINASRRFHGGSN